MGSLSELNFCLLCRQETLKAKHALKRAVSSKQFNYSHINVLLNLKVYCKAMRTIYCVRNLHIMSYKEGFMARKTQVIYARAVLPRQLFQ